MKMYVVTVEVGHVGSGRSVTATRHIVAKDSADAFEVAKSLPRVKEVVKVEPIRSLKRFVLGLLSDLNDIWCGVHVPTQTILLLIEYATKLGGVSSAD